MSLEAGSGVKQLLFARPRLLHRHETAPNASVDAALLRELSSIRCEFYPCTRDKKKKKKETDKLHVAAASKTVDAVSKSVAHKAQIHAASRSGDVVRLPSSKPGKHYDIDYTKPLASIRVRYAVQDQLVNKGLCRPPSTPPDHDKKPAVATTSAPPKRKRDDDVIDLS